MKSLRLPNDVVARQSLACLTDVPSKRLSKCRNDTDSFPLVCTGTHKTLHRRAGMLRNSSKDKIHQVYRQWITHHERNGGPNINSPSRFLFATLFKSVGYTLFKNTWSVAMFRSWQIQDPRPSVNTTDDRHLSRFLLTRLDTIDGNETNHLTYIKLTNHLARNRYFFILELISYPRFSNIPLSHSLTDFNDETKQVSEDVSLNLWIPISICSDENMKSDSERNSEELWGLRVCCTNRVGF